MYKETLKNFDSEIFNAINKELKRQQDNVELIASENIVSKAVLEAQGSVLTNNMQKGTRGGVITAAANMLMKLNSLPLTG